MGPNFEFRILGPFEVLRDGVPVPIRAAKLRTLLVSLLLDANEVVPVEALVDRLWGDDSPGGARNTLQNYVLRSRRLLGRDGADGPLLTCPRGYLIRVADDRFDLRRFDTLTSRARAAATADAPEQASSLLREALRLWRGEPLQDVPSDTLRRDVAPVLAERRLDALQSRIEADLTLGRHEEVLPELRRLTAGHPLRERFWAQRMLALYRSGRQAEALRCYRSVREVLVEELGVDPGTELRELHRRILDGDPTLTVAAGPGDDPSASGNLPAEMTTFVGRGRQLADTGRLLKSSRLVTLTGVGGVGKTRLALRAAAQVSALFPDGAWLADLAPLSEPELLDRSVAQALGVRDQSARPCVEILVEHLRDRRALLVLDNCEHMVNAAATLVATLLRAAPGLRVLATSRQRLGVQGEHVLPVPPLSVPPATPPTGEDAEPSLTRYEAVTLLADRAAASAPGFRITRHNRGVVAQLCKRLDGIPLAIELAAVRLGTLSAEEILDRLDDRFRLLADDGARSAPHHHRTLRDVIGWSHDLCTEHERLLWARLSVFSGGFDLEAAEAVCSGAGIDRQDVMDVLAGLAHKSILVVSVRGGRTRYSLLETIRQYGRQRLLDLGQDASMRRRHRDHYRNTAAQAAADWCSPREVEWLSRLRQDLPNLRAALDLCVTEPDEARIGLEIAVNLTRTRCWFFSSTIGEGRHWLERGLALAPRPSDPLRVGAVALVAWIALCQGDKRGADRFLACCRRLASRLPGGDVPAAVTYIEGAHALLVQGDPRAIHLLAQARDRSLTDGATGDAHMATMLWAMASAFFGDRDAAVTAGGEYLADAEALGGAWAYSWALWALGLAESRHGDPVRAAVLFRDSLRRQHDIDDRWGPVWGSETLAWSIAAVGHHEHAAELLGAAHRLRRTTGVALIGLRPFHDAHAEADFLVRSALGVRAYATAFERGAGTEDLLGLACPAP
ncbi:BTAD domain-containing putative transcriptional regulator [Streptosporangium sp. NBC_01756]|uniref:BTAD domain-containing putative transcriptional regulator n=1 Tax=Streptosporangium sp. NBC_01756 TaxID=2975950 RepID=UPI002DD9DA51|nr:BTAD domain-containing putative transcriptional regulator [Streptosporangium sp. NBC_01756]WSC87175.1 winged helix-turn-helix domain-containing protein [Streptosporangium sp. NBC_01756]